MLTGSSWPLTPRATGRSTPESHSDAYQTADEFHAAQESLSRASDDYESDEGFATPLTFAPFQGSGFVDTRWQEDFIRRWTLTQMGSSQSTPKADESAPRSESDAGSEAVETPRDTTQETSPVMHTRSSTRQHARADDAQSSPDAATYTTPATGTKRARATRRTTQATVEYPKLTPLKDQVDAEQIEHGVPSSATAVNIADVSGAASPATTAISSSPLATREKGAAQPKRNLPTAVVVIPSTVPTMTASLRERGLEKQANALEALQEQAKKDPGSATLLDALLAGKKLTSRMHRDWQRYVDDVETVKKDSGEDQDGQQTKSKKSKRKRAVDEAIDGSDVEAVQQPLKQLKMDDDDVAQDSSDDDSNEDVSRRGEPGRPIGLTEEERRQRKKEKNRRRHPHPPKTGKIDGPDRVVLDVADTPVVLKRRKHKGSRGLGKRKKAVLARKQLQLAQEESVQA